MTRDLLGDHKLKGENFILASQEDRSAGGITAHRYSKKHLNEAGVKIRKSKVRRCLHMGTHARAGGCTDLCLKTVWVREKPILSYKGYQRLHATKGMPLIVPICYLQKWSSSLKTSCLGRNSRRGHFAPTSHWWASHWHLAVHCGKQARKGF